LEELYYWLDAQGLTRRRNNQIRNLRNSIRDIELNARIE